MNSRADNLTDIEKLLKPGILGNYTHVEVTQVAAFSRKDKRPRNIFAILVAQEGDYTPTSTPATLGGVRINSPSIKTFCFGLYRFILPVDGLLPFLSNNPNGPGWKHLAHSYDPASLLPIPDRFVPADTHIFATPAINSVIKNNFWCGSHVFEWADDKRAIWQEVLRSPSSLQNLSEEIGNHLPIQLAAVSDKVGSFILQLPVNVITASTRGEATSDDILLDYAWAPGCPPRDVRVTITKRFDDLITTNWSSDLKDSPMALPILDRVGPYEVTLWDDSNKILIAHIGPHYLTETIVSTVSVQSPENRVFKAAGTTHQVSTVSGEPSMITHSPRRANRYDSTRDRIYQAEIRKKRDNREFVQYRTRNTSKATAHIEALDDLIFLINRHGMNGAWLWDPYLSAEDILATLFHCRYRNVDLRALTAGKEAPSKPLNPQAPSIQPASPFEEQQRSILDANSVAPQELKLEYRNCKNIPYSGFHDRFLIFPPAKDIPVKAWSLGTSVNSFGKEHHILHLVSDGAMIVDEFLYFWNQLYLPENLIWKR